MIFYIVKWIFIYLLLIMLIDKIYDFFRDTLTIPYVEKSFIHNTLEIDNNNNISNNNNNINKDNNNISNNINKDNNNDNKNNNKDNNNHNITSDNKLNISCNMENELNNFIKILEK